MQTVQSIHKFILVERERQTIKIGAKCERCEGAETPKAMWDDGYRALPLPIFLIIALPPDLPVGRWFWPPKGGGGRGRIVDTL